MALKAEISEVLHYRNEALYSIVEPLDLPGFEHFLTTWLVRRADGDILVECGPAGVSGELNEALHELNSTPALLMLTHIHIDHAGGAGHLCARFPEMKVFCFERAAKHLIDPEKLWNGSKATLGEAMADAYQPMKPVPVQRIIDRGALPADWRVLDTPGHAQHHLSFITVCAGSTICFAGEALGTMPGQNDGNWFADGVWRPFLRPATPPKYKQEISFASIDKLAVEKWDLLCVGHCGSTAEKGLPKREKRQLALWQKTIAAAMERGLDEDQTLDTLLETDPELAAFSAMKPGVQQRERYFFGNSWRGIREYLEETAD